MRLPLGLPPWRAGAVAERKGAALAEDLFTACERQVCPHARSIARE